MDSPSTRIAAEELLAHSAWMRALARGLLRDAAAADDVVQEATLAALDPGAAAKAMPASARAASST